MIRHLAIFSVSPFRSLLNSIFRAATGIVGELGCGNVDLIVNLLKGFSRAKYMFKINM